MNALPPPPRSKVGGCVGAFASLRGVQRVCGHERPSHMDMLNHGAPDSSNQCVTSCPGRCTVGSCASSFGSVSVQVTSLPELGWLEMNLMIGSS